MIRRFFPLAFLVAFAGCKLLDTAPLQITRYTPTQAIVDPSSLDTVGVTFSAVPDRTSAEEAFSLTADGLSLDGAFYWSSTTLEFSPYVGWKEGTDYQMSIDVSVEDEEGRSLDRDFAFEFSTRTETDRPTLLSSVPADSENIDILRPSVTLVFSEFMDPGSVVDAFRLSPSADGFFTWDADGDVFTYVLTEDLEWQTYYELSLSDDAVDLQNNSLADSWESTFFTGIESENPSLVSLTDPDLLMTASRDDLGDSVLTINSGWETDWPIVLSFSEAMDPDSLSGNVSISPDVSMEEEWNAGGDVLTLTPETSLDWGETYTVLISTGLTDAYGNALDEECLYNLRADGSASQSPSIAGMIIYTDPSDASEIFIPSPYDDVSLANFASPPGSITTGNAVVDIFLDMADGALPDLVSLAENFNVSGEGVNSFTPLAAALEDSTFNPSNIGTSAYGPGDPLVTYDTWVRFIVYIDNDDTYDTGILTLSISGEFSDDGERIMGDDWEMPILISD